MQPIIQDNDRVLERLARFADEIFLMRQARNRHLPGDLLGEPVWDILLSLYRKNSSARFGDLCRWSGVPEATAQRWVVVLEQRGLLARPHTTDMQNAEISLTRDGRAVLERSLEAMLLVAHE